MVQIFGFVRFAHMKIRRCSSKNVLHFHLETKISISDISQQQQRVYNSGLAPHVTDDNKSFDNKGPGQASAAFPPGVYIPQIQYAKQHSRQQLPQKHFQQQPQGAPSYTFPFNQIKYNFIEDLPDGKGVKL